jgi:UDP-N-acetylglucosamine acyltransferase
MNWIHHTAIVEGDVTIGSGNTIGAYAVITGPARLGDDNWIGAGCMIGAPAEVRDLDSQSFTRHGGPQGTTVILGDRNVIREGAQVHRGWKSTTKIGDDVFIMNQSYIAHDCTVGNSVTMASSSLLAGHVTINDGANLGLGTKVHQFRQVGRLAMLGMGSVVTRDIPPFAKAFGSPARVRSANTLGMKRFGIEDSLVELISLLYSGKLAEEIPDIPLPQREQDLILNWVSEQRAAG